MATSYRISVIICTYNRSHLLSDTLESLLRGQVNTEDFELLIIDNNSSDETSGVISKIQKKYSDHTVRYFRETKQGLSFARNRGIKEARFPILLFLDDDIIASENLISNWLKFFENQPQAQCAGGKIKVQFDDPRPAWMSHFLLPLLGHHDFGDSVKKYRRTNYPFGGNMAFKKEVFEHYGMFDTNLGRKGAQLTASEEKEFFLRIKEQQLAIYYVPDAQIYHRVNNQRLAKDYIKRQAIGLGKSKAMQHKNSSHLKKNTVLAEEGLKYVISFFLFLAYTITLQWSKGIMLLKFRYWILRGYGS